MGWQDDPVVTGGGWQNDPVVEDTNPQAYNASVIPQDIRNQVEAPASPKGIPETAANYVRRIAKGSLGLTPTNIEEVRNLLNPRMGRSGLSRVAEEEAARVEKAVNASAENLATKAAESKVGQENPKAVAAVAAPLQVLTEALSGALRPSAVQEQIGAEAVGPAVKGIAKASGAGKRLAKIGQVATGVKSQEFERLAKDPTAIFTAKSKAEAGRIFDEALKKEGLDVQPTTSELFDPQLNKAREIATEVHEKVIKNEPVSAQELLKARRATDRIIAGTSSKDKAAIQKLTEVRGQFNDMLSEISPETAKASKVYARSAMAGKFRNILPVTATGEPSVTRSFIQPLLAGAAGVGTGGFGGPLAVLAASSPIVAGIVTSLGSMSTKAAMKVVENPVVQRLVISEYQKRIGQNEQNRQSPNQIP